jgi:GNAT superfamily N-acetyltransferase
VVGAGYPRGRVSEPIVRRAALEDLEGLLALYRTLAGETLSGLPGDSEHSRTILERILGEPSRHLLVATLDGELAGTADMTLISHLMRRGMPWAVVENVVVAERFRRCGVASALFARMIVIAREAGCCKLELMSGKHRTGAHDFYRSVGMSAVAEGFKIYLDE